MALQIDTVEHACQMITRQIRETFRPLTVNFIIHHDGQLTEALGIAAQDMLSHPAAETAMHIMRKRRPNEDSALLGVAVARERILFGLASRDSALALCTLNIDHFDTLKEVRRHAYHIAWHAIDAYRYHSAPETRDDSAGRVIIRKRNALDMASANLRADAFSALMGSLQDDYEGIRKLGQYRGVEAISRRSSHMPEYYPFVIAMEATEVAAQYLRRRNLPRKKLLAGALQSAHEVGKTFDNVLLRQWLGFSQPAQDMAFRGFERDEILSAAINTSPNTYVRAAGYLISEINDIPPASIFDIRESYSPFADDQFNAKLHEKLVNKIFEDVIAEGLKRNSSDPFIETAERQNQQLTEGIVVGWCAAALQAAARGFDNALSHGGNNAAGAAQREFDHEQKKTEWDDLKTIGKKIVRQSRAGNPVTMSSISQMAGEDPAHAAIRRSVEATIKTPGYQRQLDNAHELSARPQPRTPAPQIGPKMQAPAMAAPGLAAPGMGPGMGMGGTAARIHQQQRQQQQQKQSQKHPAQKDEGDSARE